MKAKKEEMEKALRKALSILRGKEKNIKMKSKENFLLICSSSEQMCLMASCHIDGESSFETITLDGRYLMDVIRLCQSETVELLSSDGVLELRSDGRTNAVFQEKRVPVAEPHDISGVEIKDENFIRKCRAVMHAASDNIASVPMLQALNISGTADNVRLTALDGKRISTRGTATMSEFNVSCLRQDVQTFCAFVASKGKIIVSSRYLAYKDDDTVAVCRALAGTYYNVPEIVGRMRFPYKITCSRTELRYMIQLGAIAGVELLIDINGNTLKTSASGAEMTADGSLTFSSARAMPHVVFRIDAESLNDAVSSVTSDEVSIRLFTSTSPLEIAGAKGEKEIVMPMII